MVDTEVAEQLRRDLPQLSEDGAAELARAVVRLVQGLSPERIYLFGSSARGDAGTGSDIDLLVLVPASERSSVQLAQAAYQAVGTHVIPMDILVMPVEEFEWRSRSPSSLPSTVLREGKLLYAA